MNNEGLEKAGISIAKSSGAIDKAEKTIQTKADEKAKRIKAYRKEASRLVSMANKRLIRLEDNKLTDTPAYQKLLVGGDERKPRFSVRGKDYNQLQKEVAKLHRFLNSETSTVRGANKILKEMAKNTGIKYKNLKELKSKASKFFELASKIEQYLRTVDDMASAIGYQKIWQQINQYVQKEKISLDNSEVDIENLTMKISEAIKVYDEKENYSETVNGVKVEGWFKLDKD